MIPKNAIRKFLKSREDWSDEIDRIVAIEFAIAPRDAEREIYHVIVTHEYSTETRLEVIRMTINKRGHVIYSERVFMS